MKLSTLLTEIRSSSGPVTGIELADRLEVSPAAVARMLVALRATGQIGPEVRTEPAPGACASSGTCSLSCPGPEECSLVIDLRVTGLEIRTPTPASELAGQKALDELRD
mgnify:CR=1 FL=1